MISPTIFEDPGKPGDAKLRKTDLQQEISRAIQTQTSLFFPLIIYFRVRKTFTGSESFLLKKKTGKKSKGNIHSQMPMITPRKSLRFHEILKRKYI